MISEVQMCHALSGEVNQLGSAGQIISMALQVDKSRAS